MRVIDKALELYNDYYQDTEMDWNVLTPLEQMVWFRAACKWATETCRRII